MDKGWIKVNRKVMDNEIWESKEPFDRRSAWIDLLLLANHDDHNIMYRGQIIEVKRGQVNRSIDWLAKRWKWSRNKARGYLQALQSAKMVTTESTTQGTTITIENYSKYQDTPPTKGTTNKTTQGHQKDSPRTAQGHIQECYKNDKNEKEINNNIEIQGADSVGGYVDPIQFMKPKYQERLLAFRERRDKAQAKYLIEKGDMQ